MENIPAPLISQSLTSAEANERLLSDLEDFLGKSRLLTWYSVLKNRLSELLNSLFLFFVFIILVVASIYAESETYASTIIETLVVLSVLVMNVLRSVMEARVYVFWHKERCISKLTHLIKNDGCDWTHNSYPSQPISTLRSQVTVRGLRDGHLVNIPQTLLVCGDIIQLNLRHPAPANVKIIKPLSHFGVPDDVVLPDDLSEGQVAQNYCYKRDKEYVSFMTDTIAWYKVTQTPFLRHLTQLSAFSFRSSRFNQQKQIIERIVNFLLIPTVFVTSFFLNVLRWSIFPDYFVPADIFLRWPMLTILPLVSLCLPMLWTLSNAYGLVELHKSLDKNYASPTKWQKYLATIGGIIQAILMPYKYLKMEVLHNFGIVTAVCAVDKEYVLTGGFPTPDKVFFFKSTLVDDKQKTSVSNVEDVNVTATRIEVIPEILDITPNAGKESGLNFDEPNWQEHMNSLKAIGLNVIATSHACDKNPSAIFPSVSSRTLQLFLDKTKCCCSLAHEIGVFRYASGNLNFKNCIFVLTQNSDIESINTEDSLIKSKSRSLFQKVQDDIQSHLFSMVFHDQSRDINILLSRGSGDFIAKYCSDFWDGQDLQPMTDAEMAAIIDFFTRRSLSSYCIALAYNPLFTDSNLPNTSIGISIPHCMIDSRNQSFHDQTAFSQSINASHTLKGLSNQVFVGMVSLQYHPKADIVSLVQDLRNCGIRFIHFTVENEVRGKIFAEKLGLEAGWNCHISLSSCIDEEYDFDSESISSSGSSLTSVFNATQAYIKAKLPKGVHNVRSHLKNVDNVPLLVPLFTDCSPEAVEEMFKIMQENGEVVLCLGNAAVVENLMLFKQADIGLSLAPALSDRRECDCSMMSAIDGETSDCMTPMEVAATLNSFTSEIQIERNADISLHSIIIQSRHILSSIQKSLLFSIGSSFVISCLLLLSTIFFLPLPLSSSHLFWLMLCVIPILSISLLFSKSDPKTASLMPDRTVSVWNKDFFIFILYFAVAYVPISCVCLLIFWLSLNGLCRTRQQLSCHFVFGNTNDSNSSDLGWQGTTYQGYVLAQDCTMFFFSLYVLSSSLMFIHRTEPIWKFYKFINWPYIVAFITVIVLQVVYFVISQSIERANRPSDSILWGVNDIPIYVWIIGLLWFVLQLLLQEAIRSHIRKSFVHSQRRLRLGFQTKLGMNSPF